MKLILPVLLLALGKIPVSGQFDSWHMRVIGPDDKLHGVGLLDLGFADEGSPVLNYRETFCFLTNGGIYPLPKTFTNYSRISVGHQFVALSDFPETVIPGTLF